MSHCVKVIDSLDGQPQCGAPPKYSILGRSVTVTVHSSTSSSEARLHVTLSALQRGISAAGHLRCHDKMLDRRLKGNNMLVHSSVNAAACSVMTWSELAAVKSGSLEEVNFGFVFHFFPITTEDQFTGRQGKKVQHA